MALCTPPLAWFDGGMTAILDGSPLTSEQAETIDAYWRAANYLSAGQIYLMANPLLTQPLRPAVLAPRTVT
jgi:xylulose-5-phosphate/fructose-6-phosphate phosphoketolase